MPLSQLLTKLLFVIQQQDFLLRCINYTGMTCIALSTFTFQIIPQYSNIFCNVHESHRGRLQIHHNPQNKAVTEDKGMNEWFCHHLKVVLLYHYYCCFVSYRAILFLNLCTRPIKMRMLFEFDRFQKKHVANFIFLQSTIIKFASQCLWNVTHTTLWK